MPSSSSIGKHKVTTLPGFVSAIQNWTTNNGHPDLPRHVLFNKVKAGLDNYYGHTASVQRKAALTLDDLRCFRSRLDVTKVQDARDWCACLFAFFGLLRIKEYTDGGLTWVDVRLEVYGIALTVPFSKTSLLPAQVDLIRRDDELCPLSAYRSYVALVPSRLQLSHHPFFLSTPFSSISAVTPLHETEFIQRIRGLVRSSLHVDPSNYAGHSFRRGGTTALYLAGVPESTIAVHGRWRSLAYRVYFDSDRSQRLRLMATAQLRLRSSLLPEAYPTSQVLSPLNNSRGRIM